MKKSKSNKQTKSIFYYSYHLNKDKFNTIKDYTQTIIDTKNYISQYVYNNLLLDLFYQNKSKYDFWNLVKHLNVYKIGSSFFQQSVYDVYDKYKNTLSNLEFKTKNNSELSMTISYLVKYYRNNNFIDYLKSKNKQYIKIILDKINKYQDRLLNLVISIQKHLLNKTKIMFKSLTVNGINQLNKDKYKTIECSNNKYSNAVINLNIPKQGIIVIPTLLNEQYHKDLEYNQSSTTNNQSQIPFSLQIINDKIKITVFKNEENNTINLNNTNYIGIDVNIKNNLFYLSNNTFINHDKWIIKKYKQLQKHLSKKQKNKSKEINKIYSKKTIKRINKMNKRSKYYNDLKSNQLVKYCKNNDYNHIIMEDLNLQSTKGKKTNKMIKTLHLNDYKNTIKRIANKNNITVSYTNPDYTSQTCSKCGYISKNNRKNQETFSCLKCNHKLNADYNASINIKNRISNIYLRNKLHNKQSDNSYVGKSWLYKGNYINTYKYINEINKLTNILKSIL